MAKGKKITYSADELAWVKKHCTLPRFEALAQFCDKFNRSDVSLTHFNALCKRKGWMTGRTGRYDKGAVPLNKGKKCEPGKMGNHPNARKTQFKKGCRTGRANLNYKPVGTERITRDGYVERKVNDDMPLQSRWRAVHLIRWEEANGALPEGTCLKCLDGNRQNTHPSNWKLIPRGALPFLNGHRGHNYEETPDGLKPTVLALAQVKHAKNKALKRKQKSCEGA